MSSDCNCPYPALECPCCCKQKQILQGLVNRVSGYECYLKSIIVPASCQGLTLGATFNGIVGGGNPNYKLSYIYADYTGSSFIADTTPTATINLWPAIGCRCSFSANPVPLYKNQGDCWGALPIPGANGLVSFPLYLQNTYGSATLSSVNALITGTTNTSRTLATLKGAAEWTAEVRRVYGSILMSLPC
jgi:hypothetical protein